MDFRKLRADEIEIRVREIVKGGAKVLLYKDARCDMAILDETVGAERWQRDHKDVKGVLFGGVGIFFEAIGWVWKWDAGKESNTEAQKGESSDSFKRACFNWGIGRSLYTAPKQLTLMFETVEDGKDKWGKPIYKLKNPWAMIGVHMKEITYSGDKIASIKIADRDGKVIWEMEPLETDPISDNRVDWIKEQCQNDEGKLDAIKASLGVKSLEVITNKQFKEVIALIKKGTK